MLEKVFPISTWYVTENCCFMFPSSLACPQEDQEHNYWKPDQEILIHVTGSDTKVGWVGEGQWGGRREGGRKKGNEDGRGWRGEEERKGKSLFCSTYTCTSTLARPPTKYCYPSLLSSLSLSPLPPSFPPFHHSHLPPPLLTDWWLW